MGKRGPTPTDPEKRKLPRKQLNFLRAYQAGDNGKPITIKEAAIRSGYPEATAAQQGSWIMSRPAAKVWLEAQAKKVEAAHDITMDKIVRELAKVGFSNMADYIQDDGNGKPQFRKVGDLSRDHMAAVTELTLDVRKEFEGRGEDREHVADVEKIRFKLASKIDGLVNLAKLLGHFPKNGGGDDGPEGGGDRKVIIEVRGGLPRKKS